MKVKRIELVDKKIESVDYMNLDCPENVADSAGFKNLIELLMRSIRTDVSFLIPFKEDETIDNLYIIQEGFPTTNLLAKDVLGITLHAKEHDFVILSIFKNKNDYDFEKVAKDYDNIKSFIKIFGYSLHNYLCVVENKVYALANNETI